MGLHLGESLHDYLDGELNEADRLTIEKHLEICSECKNQLIELTSLRQMLFDTYQMIEIPDMIEDRVMAKIEQDTIKSYSGMLNRMAVIMMFVFGVIFLAGTTPFLSIGLSMISAMFSITRGLIYAIPSIISAIPYVVSAIAVIIILLIVMALFIVRYLIHNMAKTIGAEDI